MKKAIFGIIALILLTTILLRSYTNFAISVIPGWHTLVLPKLFIIRTTGLWLLAVIAIYFFALKKETSTTTTYTYLLMTVPFLLYDILPLLFDIFGFITMYVYITLLCITILPFLVAQVIFIVKLFSYTIKKRVQ